MEPERNQGLSGLKVKDAMRRFVVSVRDSCAVGVAITQLIKHKVSGILVTDWKDDGIGVITNSTIVGAFYAGMPLETPVRSIMASPPSFCGACDDIADALGAMRALCVNRLYVSGEKPTKAIGVVAQRDIAGLLYRTCRNCERGAPRYTQDTTGHKALDLYRVSEVMLNELSCIGEGSGLKEVMEVLVDSRAGVLLVKDRAGFSTGVISENDITLAYKRGVPIDSPAASIMSAPVRACRHDDSLLSAINSMIFSDMQHLFVHRGDPSAIVGVISLAEAARVRSGSCLACLSARIRVEIGM